MFAHHSESHYTQNIAYLCTSDSNPPSSARGACSNPRYLDTAASGIQQSHSANIKSTYSIIFHLTAHSVFIQIIRDSRLEKIDGHRYTSISNKVVYV